MFVIIVFVRKDYFGLVLRCVCHFLLQNQQREFTLRQAKEMEKDAKQRLAIQRQEYEAAIQRHLSFIDQLIDDKKVLSERCEEVVNKLKSTDKKYGDKIKQMEEK